MLSKLKMVAVNQQRNRCTAIFVLVLVSVLLVGMLRVSRRFVFPEAAEINVDGMQNFAPVGDFPETGESGQKFEEWHPNVSDTRQKIPTPRNASGVDSSSLHNLATCEWAMNEPRRRRIVPRAHPTLPYCKETPFAYGTLMKTFSFNGFFERLIKPPPRHRASLRNELFVLAWGAQSEDVKFRRTAKGINLGRRLNQTSVFYFFEPNTTWTTGRNFILERIYDREIEMGCLFGYIIMLDGDVQYPQHQYEDHLIRFEPAMGFLPHQSQNLRFLNQTACLLNADAYINAFHRSAIGYLLPYDGTDDAKSWFISQSQLVCKYKHLFPVSVLVFGDIGTAVADEHNSYPRSFSDWGGAGERCLQDILKNFPELYGTQKPGHWEDEHRGQLIKGEQECLPSQVSLSKQSSFLARNDYVAILERWVNARLALFPENIRDVLLLREEEQHASSIRAALATITSVPKAGFSISCAQKSLWTSLVP